MMMLKSRVQAVLTQTYQETGRSLPYHIKFIALKIFVTTLQILGSSTLYSYTHKNVLCQNVYVVFPYSTCIHNPLKHNGHY